MQTLFNSKNYYTKDILSGVVDESKLMFLRNNLQRHIYVEGSLNAYRTRPSNFLNTIKAIRESSSDRGEMRDLTGIFHDKENAKFLGNIHDSTTIFSLLSGNGYYEYGGESKYGEIYKSFNSLIKHLNPFKRSTPIAWLLSNNHTKQFPHLSWSPQHDVYFLTDPFNALKLVQLTSVKARTLTQSDSDLRKLLKDFSSTNSDFINTLYNEDDLKILAKKINVELDFSHHQFNVDDWINEYCFPQPKTAATVAETSNIEKLIRLFKGRRDDKSKIVFLAALTEMNQQELNIESNDPISQILQFMMKNEINIIHEVTPREVLLSDGSSKSIISLKRAFSNALIQVELN